MALGLLLAVLISTPSAADSWPAHHGGVAVLLAVLGSATRPAADWPAHHPCRPCSCYVGRSRALRLSSAKIVDCSALAYNIVPGHLPHDLEELDLSGNLISHLSSDALNGYHSIKGLSLRHNRVVRADADAFQNATLLQYLDLEGNADEMDIPEGLFDKLDNIVSIKGLVVASLPRYVFQGLPKLRVLFIQTYQMSLPDDTFQHVALTNLRIKLCNASTIPTKLFHSGNMTLRELDIDAPYVETLDEDLFKYLYILQKIRIDAPNLQAAPRGLFQINEIDHRLIDEEDGTFKSGYRHLREITIVGLSIIPERLFQRLPNLASLTLRKVTDIPGQSFRELSRLDYFEISFSQITHIDTDWFADLGSLKEFNCSWNMLRNITDVDLMNVYSLQGLDLSHNRIEALERNVFTSFRSSLEYLDISWNNVCELPLSIFSAMWNLKSLQLQHNCLTNLDPALFVNNIEFIHQLDLQWNNLTSLPRSLFIGLQDLTYLNISNNEIAIIPDSIFHYTSLMQLDMSYNRLVHLPEEFLPVKKSISVIRIEGNEMCCDCGVTEFVLMLRRPNTEVVGFCSSPKELEGVALREVDLKVVCPHSPELQTDTAAGESGTMLALGEERTDVTSTSRKTYGKLMSSSTTVAAVHRVKTIYGTVETELSTTHSVVEQLVRKIINETIGKELDRKIDRIIDVVLKNITGIMESVLRELINRTVDVNYSRSHALRSAVQTEVRRIHVESTARDDIDALNSKTTEPTTAPLQIEEENTAYDADNIDTTEISVSNGEDSTVYSSNTTDEFRTGVEDGDHKRKQREFSTTTLAGDDSSPCRNDCNSQPMSMRINHFWEATFVNIQDGHQVERHRVLGVFSTCVKQNNTVGTFYQQAAKQSLQNMNRRCLLQSPSKMKAFVNDSLHSIATAQRDQELIDDVTKMLMDAGKGCACTTVCHKSNEQYHNMSTVQNETTMAVIELPMIQPGAFNRVSLSIVFILGLISGALTMWCAFEVHNQLQGRLFKKHHVINIV